MDNKELLNRIDKEMELWQNYYNNIDMFIYTIAALCWRTADNNERSSIGELSSATEHTVLQDVSSVLNAYFDDIDNTQPPLYYINQIYTYVMSYLGDKGTKYIEDLSNSGSEDATLVLLSVEDAINEIAEQLIARDNIQKEAYVSLRTLQWVKDLIPKENETE